MIENWTEMQPTLFNVENIQLLKFFSTFTSFFTSSHQLHSFIHIFPQGIVFKWACLKQLMISSWIGFLLDMQQKPHTKKDYLDLFYILYFDLSSQEWGLKAIKLEGNSLIACTSDKSARAAWLMASWLFPGPWEARSRSWGSCQYPL